jgi:hypothetical protein
VLAPLFGRLPAQFINADVLAAYGPQQHSIHQEGIAPDLFRWAQQREVVRDLVRAHIRILAWALCDIHYALAPNRARDELCWVRPERQNAFTLAGLLLRHRCQEKIDETLTEIKRKSKTISV